MSKVAPFSMRILIVTNLLYLKCCKIKYYQYPSYCFNYFSTFYSIFSNYISFLTNLYLKFIEIIFPIIFKVKLIFNINWVHKMPAKPIPWVTTHPARMAMTVSITVPVPAPIAVMGNHSGRKQYGNG